MMISLATGTPRKRSTVRGSVRGSLILEFREDVLLYLSIVPRVDEVIMEISLSDCGLPTSAP